MKGLEYSRRCPGRPLRQAVWFDICRIACELFMKLVYRFRTYGMERVPASGPCIFVSNHQSFYDPILNGLAVKDRQLTAMARESLFRWKPFALLMHSIGAIRLKEEGGDAAAFKAALAELAAGRCILIYPEGSRSPDGRVDVFQPGLALLVRRARVPVLPMAVEGAHDVWPRGQSLPRLSGRLAAEVGEMLAFESLPRDPEALLQLLRSRVAELQERCGVRMRRAGWRPRPRVVAAGEAA